MDMTMQGHWETVPEPKRCHPIQQLLKETQKIPTYPHSQNTREVQNIHNPRDLRQP